ncbi:MAG: precorrin-8X methylmutase [Desulfobulbaceae bacterium]|jgi:precorrin-8X/cobalt-precorrin-8 methylmutase|nr:precorrin-8X methylmutase [Desulfobulbaceae bacterium]
MPIQNIKPEDIEKESFRIIFAELGPHSFDAATLSIVQRVIHATGDFSFAENLHFSADAIVRGITALRQGKDILTDVTMVKAGISKAMFARWHGAIRCGVDDPAVAAAAKRYQRTRSQVAMERLLDESVGIVAIGNAPTALLQIIDMLDGFAPRKAPLVIGTPVGFVNAAESKDLLIASGRCHIACRGRKGGSPVAAAIVNALLRLAIQEEDR